MRFYWKKQSGAVAIITAGFLAVAVLCLVLVVDTARLYYEKRSLQRVADMAALDTASQGGFCGSSSSTNLTALAKQSAEQNGYPVSDWLPQNTIKTGSISVQNGVRQFSQNPSQSEAVQVVLHKSVPASLIMGGPFADPVNLQATAVARRLASASFSVGSGLLTLNTQVSPLLGPILGGLLGSDINLSALDYNGVVNANVNLLEFLELLKVKAGLGSVDDVLTTDVDVLDVIDVIADVMAGSSNSGLATVGSNLLGGNFLQLDGAKINLGEILGLAAGNPAINSQLSTNVNLFDLLLASATVANGNNFLDLQIPNVLGLASATLQVIEPPQIGVGRPGKHPSKITPVNTEGWHAFANTGQVKLVLNIKPDINLGLAETTVDLALRIGLSEASAWLKSIECSTTKNNQSRVVIGAKAQTDNVRITSIADETKAASVKIRVLGESISAKLSLGNGGSIIANEQKDLYFTATKSRQPDGSIRTLIDPEVQRITSQTSLGLPPIVIQGSPECSGLLGCLLSFVLSIAGNVVGSVSELLNGVLAILNPLVNSILTTLGISIGYADVRLIDVNEGRVELVR